MPLTILEDSILHDGKFVRLIKRDFKDKDGKPQHWEMVKRRTYGPIVAVAALTPQNALVVNRIFRVPLNGWTLELPAGLMDKPGEDPLDVARRELLEETGYDGEGFHQIMSGPLNSGLSEDILTIFGARNARRTQEPELEPTEDIQVLTLTAQELERALLHPPQDTLVDIKLFSILWWMNRVAAG